jgi:hypothetical protein
MLGLAMTACKKDNTNNEILNMECEISFSITPKANLDGLQFLKDWECKPYEPDYAIIILHLVIILLPMIEIISQKSGQYVSSNAWPPAYCANGDEMV